MKWEELPKFIEDGNYEITVRLPELVNKIETYKVSKDKSVVEYNLDMNPDFQRGHVWMEEQQIKYIETLLMGGAKNARVIYLNCPDWSFNNENNYHDFVCIDGLQRYTAIKRFINNEIKVFGCYLNEIEDKDKMLRRVEMRLNINSLKSKKDVLKWYLQINDGGTPHTKEEIERVKKLYEKELGK